MAHFPRGFLLATAVLAVLLINVPGPALGGERTRTVAPTAWHGNTAVFEPPRALAAAVVSGELVAGVKRRPLRPAHIRALARRGVLRLRVPRRPARVLLSLRMGPGGGSAGAGPPAAGATPQRERPKVAVGPAIAADPGGDHAFDPLAGGRLYSSTSPFNQPLPANPVIAADSAAMVESLLRARAQKGFVLAVDEWTVPTYVADASTPRQTVSLGSGPPAWGLAADFPAYPPGGSEGGLPDDMPERLHGVPIPAGAQPDLQLDAHMTIVDRAANCEYDLYGAYRGSDGWHATWANSTRLDGSGVYPRGMGAKAAGFASLAGLIWPQELRAGRIDHALFFAYPFTKSGGPVSPATAGDGRSEVAGAIPQGARVQLDPHLDLDSLDLQPYQRTIAEALQTYGMILGDTGGAFSLYAVGSQSVDDAYDGLLPREEFPEFPDLSRIPVDRFRVLELPPQQPGPPQELVVSGCGSFG